jgi:hypothetical protein
MIKSSGKRLAGSAVCIGEKRTSEGKKRLGRSRHKWEDNIEKNLREIDWIHKDRWRALVNKNFHFP